MAAPQKLFSDSDIAALRDRLVPAIAGAMKASGAGAPIAFTAGMRDAIGAAIGQAAISVARLAAKRADAQQKTISDLVVRLDRVQQQQSAQASRLAALE